MTIGNRISTLRKQFRYSQEYIAEQLGVSRQAVSKWEKDISKPDTDNIIQLAELFDSTVDFILTGKTSSYNNENEKQPKKIPHKQKRKICLCILSILGFVSTVSVVLCVHLCPVDWEAGACGGGYVTSIYDIYSDELTEKFINGMEYDKEKIMWAEPVKGTQSATTKDRKIFLEFDVTYEHSEYGIKTERIHFIGTRYWINSFNWSGAIIEG